MPTVHAAAAEGLDAARRAVQDAGLGDRAASPWALPFAAGIPARPAVDELDNAWRRPGVMLRWRGSDLPLRPEVNAGIFQGFVVVSEGLDRDKDSIVDAVALGAEPDRPGADRAGRRPRDRRLLPPPRRDAGHPAEQAHTGRPAPTWSSIAPSRPAACASGWTASRARAGSSTRRSRSTVRTRRSSRGARSSPGASAASRPSSATWRPSARSASSIPTSMWSRIWRSRRPWA